ncbi:hypothetical protein GFK82_00077 [Candidatus Steffania adelgidicola]|nr:hypothetical protein GFK82_00077 [Candidatus Steffania adelgidicola]
MLSQKFGAVTMGDIERHINDKAIGRGWKPSIASIFRLEDEWPLLALGPSRTVLY